MPDHHIKAQPAASMYVREKGCVTFDTNSDSSCIIEPLRMSCMVTSRNPQGIAQHPVLNGGSPAVFHYVYFGNASSHKNMH